MLSSISGAANAADKAATLPIDGYLIAARHQLQAHNFAGAYDSLDAFAKKYQTLKKDASDTDKLAHSTFVTKFQSKAKLLQLGCGYALEKPKLVLALPKSEVKNDYWLAIERRLNGKDGLNSKADSEKTKSAESFVPWCHYALGVKAMSRKDLKTAAKEFEEVNSPLCMDMELKVCARVLKNYCAEKKN